MMLCFNRPIILLCLIFIGLNTSYSQCDTMRVVSSIDISGNYKTKRSVILRELAFSVGDTLSLSILSEKMAQSQKNLMNISLFNFVEIDKNTDSLQNTSILIKVTERWYIWPIPIFDFADRNFNVWWKTRDFSRLNYGVDLTMYNFRGRNQTLQIIASYGYDERFGLAYQIPAMNKKQTIGVGFGLFYQRSHELAINAKSNKELFFKSESEYPDKQLSFYSEIFYRPDIHNHHQLQIGFQNRTVSDSVRLLNPDYFDGFRQNNAPLITLYYKYKHDYRDYRPYPLSGTYWDIELLQTGIHFEKDDGLAILMGKATYRKYLKLSSKWYFAAGISGMVLSQKSYPWFLENGLGYKRDYVRGYEYYLIKGNAYGLIRTNLKYNLLSTKLIRTPYVQSEKFNPVPVAFYITAFVDAGYVSDSYLKYDNELSNKWLSGCGVGLDWVTYYDKVIRFEFSVNRKAESGIFIHFMSSL
jgi:outer membrane protein assembly factor BamA